MWKFLLKIFSKEGGDVTVVVLDEQDPDGSSSFSLKTSDVIRLALVVVFISVLFTTVIFFTTPLGSLYLNKQDEELKMQALKISERLLSLEDSLQARDQQLMNMKEVLRTVPDTTFTIRYSNDISEYTAVSRTNLRDINAYEMLSSDEIIFSGSLKESPDFPAAYPIKGTISQHYSSADGHLGLDIAARPGTEFRALADGIIMKASWTINYGYVLYVQHANGFTSVYKHGAKILKQQGDFVLKGDILGFIGDSGVLSSGSHLHLEIWNNGVHQNPLLYLNE